MAHGDHGNGDHGDGDHGDGDHGDATHHEDGHGEAAHGDDDHAAMTWGQPFGHGGDEHGGGLVDEGSHAGDAAHADPHAEPEKPYMTGDWWTLGQFGKLKLTIGYYIDALTVAMFCMVTLIASCIHFYAMGYMHDELHDFTDPEVTTRDGQPFTRPGRYHRFFQALSLFCFSMLGLVIAGNIAMTFVFWELVGICSYFLIGFYVERPSASTAANKAFIVNRVGDFGMIIGLMALWAASAPLPTATSMANSGCSVWCVPRMAHYELAGACPDGGLGDAPNSAKAAPFHPVTDVGLLIGGLGIFCGCIGKSAQFPLHVWLPDAMEGPTPVSALVHSATMVAAGVFLVARFLPGLHARSVVGDRDHRHDHAVHGGHHRHHGDRHQARLGLFDRQPIGLHDDRVGSRRWLGRGVMHLFTHAFFKSLLFMCSGSVIHAVHTNEMTEMGGLRKKMPWTAYTMLIGCLAIAGAGIPFVIGLSGYYSKDAILEQSLLFGNINPGLGKVFFIVAAGGAAITAFYMFRLWYLTFAGANRAIKSVTTTRMNRHR